ncbi:hypothetical protein [Chryseobacterium sp. EO14]|uniref:hypothetical protein n=1 Tax=Chryseobacterium sp. EO14 TaxID=2950551 RepID=UPI00210EEB27|nr:hypothetical protein [Chryseobacterium sp. EO14]MCQ4140608.1 hypothetical protein [Chryseobacterium sp. EO14]
MNLTSAQKKIGLYRRLNEQDSSFRYQDFDNYNEFFTERKSLRYRYKKSAVIKGGFVPLDE